MWSNLVEHVLDLDPPRTCSIEAFGLVSYAYSYTHGYVTAFMRLFVQVCLRLRSPLLRNLRLEIDFFAESRRL